MSKLVQITPMSLWFMVLITYNYSSWGESKPTYNWGASHCRKVLFTLLLNRPIEYRENPGQAGRRDKTLAVIIFRI